MPFLSFIPVMRSALNNFNFSIDNPKNHSVFVINAYIPKSSKISAQCFWFSRTLVSISIDIF